MSDEFTDPDAAPAVYINLLAAYIALTQIRDYLRFLAKLTEPREGDNPELMVHPEELTWCFSSIASDLTHVAESVRWSAKAQHP